MNSYSLSLYVVDDDADVRRSLVTLLSTKGLAVQSFESGEQFLATISPEACGCVVLDLRMAAMNGLEVFQALKQRCSPLVVLFLSGHGDIPVAIEAVKQGAFDWIVKPNSEHLLDRLNAAIAEAAERAEALNLWSRLTPRECEVAPWVAKGIANKEIARLLSEPCSPRSVETHRAHVFTKLMVSGAHELARWMERHRWLHRV
jgi:two-component system, LuxR family, response regulator TtrR